MYYLLLISNFFKSKELTYTALVSCLLFLCVVSYSSRMYWTVAVTPLWQTIEKSELYFINHPFF